VKNEGQKMNKIICIASDHAGYEMKEKLKKSLALAGEIKDFGTNSRNPVDYPDFVHPLAEYVEENHGAVGILLCGSANGMAMAANKHEGIRAAICWNKETAALARQHNDANILCLPARFVSEETANEITKAFLNASFEGGRHEKRVKKINPSTEKAVK
jgi:ribose 5-phosphate isomerase B